MWNLAMLVIDDASRLDEVLKVWEAAGVRGATIMESSGLARRRGHLQDDLPLFPSVSSLMQGSKNHNVTIFAVLEESVRVEALLAGTERVIGDLSQPNTGIFTVMPLSYVKGVRET